MADADLKARNTDGIVGLEIDPFINDGNGPGANAPFNVQSAVINRDSCQVKLTRGYQGSEVRPELMKTQSGWIFTNFHYSFYGEDGKTKELPDDDLIHMLKTE